MKKSILLILLIASLLTSCKSFIANYYMKSVGVYDNKIKLEKLTYNDSEIIFFGMHHIGKNEFYDDVKKKTDSLLKEDYIFYIEGISSQFADKKNLTKEESITLIEISYKFRKILGKPLVAKNMESDYIKLFKEKGIKIKKNLIKQPSYLQFGLS